MADLTELTDIGSRKVIDFELGRKALEEAGRQKQADHRESIILIDPRPANALLESVVTAGFYILLALALLLAFALFCG
jgi:hypothetical protein